MPEVMLSQCESLAWSPDIVSSWWFLAVTWSVIAVPEPSVFLPGDGRRSPPPCDRNNLQFSGWHVAQKSGASASEKTNFTLHLLHFF